MLSACPPQRALRTRARGDGEAERSGRRSGRVRCQGF